MTLALTGPTKTADLPIRAILRAPIPRVGPWRLGLILAAARAGFRAGTLRLAGVGTRVRGFLRPDRTNPRTRPQRSVGRAADATSPTRPPQMLLELP